MAEFQFASSGPGAWYCACWLTVILGHLTRTEPSSVISDTRAFLQRQLLMSAMNTMQGSNRNVAQQYG